MIILYYLCKLTETFDQKIIMKFKTTFIIAAAMLMAACTGNTALTSPDGEINVSFSLNQDGVPH